MTEKLSSDGLFNGSNNALLSRHQKRPQAGPAPLASVEDLPAQLLLLASPVSVRDSPSERPAFASSVKNVSDMQLLDTTTSGSPPPRSRQPVDQYHLVYMVFVLHGIGTLMPWNMFITAKNYFVHYKLSVEYTGVVSEYATNFLPYVGFASQIPNVIINWVNVFVRIGGSLSVRIVWCLVVMSFVFVGTVLLAMVDSSAWPGAFFLTTMTSVVVMNVANGIYQNTVYGLAAKLPFRYTGAVVLGSNVSGTFTALINILSIAMAPDPRTAAIYYFITALFVLLACFDTYFALPLSNFFRYYRSRSVCAGREGATNVITSTSIVAGTPPYWHIFKCAFPQLLNVFLVFFVTLSVFPTVLADIKPVDAGFVISPRYYAAVICFLTFNLTAMIGNILPMFFVWPSARWLWVPVVLRVVLVPCLVLANYRPVHVQRLLATPLANDWLHWLLAAALGVSSGYLSSLAMMYCPRTVERQYASTAGMFAAAALVTGVCCGVQFSLLLSWLVTSW